MCYGLNRGLKDALVSQTPVPVDVMFGNGVLAEGKVAGVGLDLGRLGSL